MSFDYNTDEEINSEIAKVINDKEIKKSVKLTFPKRRKEVIINKDSNGALRSITYTNLDVAEKVKLLKQLQQYQEKYK